MGLTRNQKKQAVAHILDVVFDLDKDSPVHKALEENNITSPFELIQLPPVEYELLEYTDQGAPLKLTKGHVGCLKTFQKFVHFKASKGEPIGDNDWVKLTSDEFDQFRISPDAIRPLPPAMTAATLSSPSFSLVRDFKRSIKRDITHFIPLKDDAAWDNWERATMAQARAQDVADVLDSNYSPSSVEETALFDEKQKYMYAVFEKTLLTDKGKALVRAHQRKYDAQKIYQELSEYALKSTKATIDASSILTYITTAQLGTGNWKGTTHAFILHWQDQVRKYQTLAPKSKLPDELLRTMLENAVHPIDSLRIVKTQADQHKAHSGTDLTYSQYTSLLLSAAQQHDKQLMEPSKPRFPRRKVYSHEIEYGEPFEMSDPYSFEETEYDIDSSIGSLSVNQTFTKPSKYFPRLTREQWMRLTDEAKKTWDQLPNEMKAIILEPPNRKPNYRTAPPPRKVNAHEVAHLMECLHGNDIDIEPAPDPHLLSALLHEQSEGSMASKPVTSIPEEDTDSNKQVSAHAASQKPLPPGNIKRLLSQTSNKKPNSKPNEQHEVNINGVRYRQVNFINIQYTVTNSQTYTKRGALVDRGANGGIAGSDVRLIAKTDRHVDIQGIDNHRMNDVPIASVGAVMNTQKGDVIAIMHQFAFTGKGKTIISSGQLEAFKQTVHDKSIKVGGKQRIETLDGYIIPLNFRQGLPYVTFRPYTDKEWETLPHVTLTADVDWDPTILDCETEYIEEWHNEMQDTPTLSPDPFFDDFGDYRHTHSVTNAIQSNDIMESTIFTDLPSVFKAYEHSVKPRAIDYQRFQSKFAFLPTDVIKHTFDSTTQFYRSTGKSIDKKHFKSPFPAANVLRRNEPVASDTVFSDTPAIEYGVTAAQFYVGTKTLVSDVYPLQTEKQFVNTLQENIRNRGAMDKLITDRAQSEISTKVKDILRHYIISDWQSEPHYQHQNVAERRYQDIKRRTNKLLDWSGAPASLWLHGLMHVCYITNHAANSSIGNAIPLQLLEGTTPDISPLLQFDFYEPVYYKAHEPGFPSESVEKSGRFVGISENVGNALTYKILTDDTQKIIHRSAVRSALDPTIPNNRAKIDMDKEPHPYLKSKIDDKVTEESTQPIELVLTEPKDLEGKTFTTLQDDGQLKHAQIVEAIEDHEYKMSKHPDHLKFRCSMNYDQYEEILSYNEVMDYLEKNESNPIVWKFKRIVGHQGPLDPSSPDYQGSSYNVKIEWENGEVTYEPLAIIGADDPSSCAIYARDNNLLDLPGWRRFQRLAKRQKKLIRMANQAKLRSFNNTPKFKYGFEVARDFLHGQKLDKINGNTKWADAHGLEMDVMEDYKVFKDYGTGPDPPEGYKQIKVRMIYDVKHDGRHKARLVAGGHLTDIPLESVYSGVVSLRGLRIVVFLAELNGLQIWATDITSAYLEAFTSEKVCIKAGPEFGKLEGHWLIIDKALYGLRSSGARWHERLADCLREEGWISCRAEPDIWIRKNGNIYEYIAVYVDDLTIAMKDPASFVQVLDTKYGFKFKGTGPLAFHLGADFYRDSKGILSMAPRKYVERLIDNYTQIFGEKPRMNVYSPLEKGDHPELDTSEFLDAEGTEQYQSIIGSLQWAITLGRFDIATAVMTMSGFRAAPRRGHLKRIQRICGYIAKMRHATIKFRVHKPDYSDLPSIEYDWTYTYGDVKEPMPDDAPEPLGNQVTLTHYVDANLYHDALTGRSVTGILHMVNATPIEWFSKKQATVETATYGSEFVAARTCIEQIIDLRNTLRYLGVPINKSSYMFGDNESVVGSSSIPHAKLHKRHTALSFHKVREAVAAGYVSFNYLPGSDNPADMLSKHWAYPTTWEMLQCLLFWEGDTLPFEEDEDGN